MAATSYQDEELSTLDGESIRGSNRYFRQLQSCR